MKNQLWRTRMAEEAFALLAIGLLKAAESPFLRCDSAVIIVCVFVPAVAGLKYMGEGSYSPYG